MLCPIEVGDEKVHIHGALVREEEEEEEEEEDDDDDENIA